MRICAVRPRRTPGSHGFSMVEVLVATAIVMLVGTLAFLSLGRSDQAEVRAAAMRISQTVQEARLAAAEAQKPVAMAYDPRAHEISWGTRRLALADGVDLEWNEGRTPFALTLRPSGESDGGRLTVSRGDARAQLRIDWLTGKTQVTW